MKKRAKSGGVRNPVRNAVISGLVTVASITLVVLGAMDMHETGRSGSPLLMLGLFPALLGPIFFIQQDQGVSRNAQRRACDRSLEIVD